MVLFHHPLYRYGHFGCWVSEINREVIHQRKSSSLSLSGVRVLYFSFILLQFGESLVTLPRELSVPMFLFVKSNWTSWNLKEMRSKHSPTGATVSWAEPIYTCRFATWGLMRDAHSPEEELVKRDHTQTMCL